MMSIRKVKTGLVMAALMLLLGCATPDFSPTPIEELPLMERAQSQTRGNLTVTVAVPSAKENISLFGSPLYNRGVQAVWLKIENRGKRRQQFLVVGLDPQYYTPTEASDLSSKQSKDEEKQQLEQRRSKYLVATGVRHFIPPKETRSGFVFTRLDEGTKSFNVEFIDIDGEYERFTFFVPVPGLKIDHHSVDFQALYPGQEKRDYSVEELIASLNDLSCCTTDKDKKGSGDPLNLVVIGEPKDLYYAFIRAGWDETETIYNLSLIKTGVSFIVGGRYRYSPVSSLYALDRPQDIAYQMARDSINERNHLRLWMTPIKYRGKPVWIGQISRDIGVRYTPKTITTHKIDPDVDETREYLLENLVYARSLRAVGYVEGVGAASRDKPRSNLTGDPYFTDGRRIVLWVSSTPKTLGEIEILEWGSEPGDS